MKLRASDVDDVEKEILRGRAEALATSSLEAITLGGLLELVVRAWAWQSEANEPALALFRTWAHQQPLLLQGWRMLLGKDHSRRPTDMFSAPAYEFCMVPSKSEDSLHWDHHRDRFARSLKQEGFGKPTAYGLVGAYLEMADNAQDHSGTDEQHPAPALAAFHVAPGRMAYGVADLGRGVLASLRTKAEWSNLENSREALLAAIQQRATRRPEYKQGSGFTQVHKSIADLNGVLRFRSGDAALLLDGRPEQAREATLRNSPGLLGFQLSVTCSLQPTTDEFYL